MTQKMQLIKSLDTIRNRVNYFKQEIELILATLDYIEDSILDNRIRNEDGESAFPLERPKTCTPIIVESHWKNSKGEDQSSIHEQQYCPTEDYVEIYKPLHKIPGHSLPKEELEKYIYPTSDMLSSLDEGKQVI